MIFISSFYKPTVHVVLKASTIHVPKRSALVYLLYVLYLTFSHWMFVERNSTAIKDTANLFIYGTDNYVSNQLLPNFLRHSEFQIQVRVNIVFHVVASQN